jgi:pimeloyl-ACP methyl ester carboxylesterase
MAEDVHMSVLDTIGNGGSGHPGLGKKLTQAIYQTVQHISQLVGKTTDVSLAGLQSLFEHEDSGNPKSQQRDAILAILNGIIGDRLVADGNTLARPMTFNYQGQVLDLDALPAMPVASGKVLLLIHGLCMSNMRQPGTQARDYGEVLAAELGYSPVYLSYNSGLHISQNGRELAAQTELLLKNWPVEIEELTIVAHSMGGLVTRSARHYGAKASLQWVDSLKNIVFLGTPHHGAPLEQAGQWLDTILDSTPYSRPFAALGRMRSAGIADLHSGNLLDEEVCDSDTLRVKTGRRENVPLPDGVNCYTVAAMTARRSNPASRLLGDGLVPLKSALGQHHDEQRKLKFEASAQHIAHGVNHMGLLSDPGIKQQIVNWLAVETVGAPRE